MLELMIDGLSPCPSPARTPLDIAFLASTAAATATLPNLHRRGQPLIPSCDGMRLKRNRTKVPAVGSFLQLFLRHNLVLDTSEHIPAMERDDQITGCCQYGQCSLAIAPLECQSCKERYMNLSAELFVPVVLYDVEGVRPRCFTMNVFVLANLCHHQYA
jgi:hypothetical protein